MSKTKLLPCPCCGKDVKIESWYKSSSCTSMHIECCGTTIDGMTRAEVTKIWNSLTRISCGTSINDKDIISEIIKEVSTLPSQKALKNNKDACDLIKKLQK